MDAYIIIEEVPYRLNVVSGNIALLPIAVELFEEHLRLVKRKPAKVCINLLLVALYFRNYTMQVRGMAGLLNFVWQVAADYTRNALLSTTPLSRHRDRHYYSIYQTCNGRTLTFNPLNTIQDSIN